ncbi:MAG: hypothetical protein EA375_00510 [Acholeplasmataceae bacterium]|nr:MAG: hypothetical protein EA375_00510 [Acholeplasmataceae bacterium]
MKRAYYFFQQTIQKNRLSHLYLICGPKGSGKSELVNDVAYLILNQNKPESPHLKHQIKENKVANMMVIEPDGAMIKKEQILMLQMEFSKTALVSGPRLYIIKNVEKMNQSAANSLLKFMEEPLSKKVYGFLLTEDRDAVIRTIVSRSQVIQLKSIDEKDLEKELLAQGVDAKAAAIAPYLTKNSEEAEALSTDPNFLTMVAFIEELATLWSDKQTSFPLYFAQKGAFLTQERQVFETFLELLLIYHLDLIHYRAHQDIAFSFLQEQVRKNSDLLSVTHINDIIDQIQDALEKQSYFINLELALDHLAYTLEKKR